MKTTFDFKFDFYQALKHHGYTKPWEQRETVYLKSFSLITCKIVILKKLVNSLHYIDIIAYHYKLTVHCAVYSLTSTLYSLTYTPYTVGRIKLYISTGHCAVRRV